MRIFAASLILAVIYAHANTAPSVPRLDWPAGPVSVKQVLRVIEEFSIPVPNADRAQKVGDQVLLFDINPDYFVGVIQDDFAPINVLVAYPRVSSSAEGTAWVTNEKQLIFGSRSRSTPGYVLIRRGEVLPIVGENSQTYTVMMERFGRQVSLEVSKSLPVFAVQDFPPPPVYVAAEPTHPPPAQESESVAEPKLAAAPAAKPAAPKAAPIRRPLGGDALTALQPTVVISRTPEPRPHVPEPAPAVTASPSPAPTSASASSAPVVATVTESSAANPPEPLAEPAPTPAPTPAVVTAPAAELVAIAEPKPEEPKPEARIAAPNVVFTEPTISSYFSLSRMTIWILLGTVLVEAGMITMMFRKKRKAAAPASSGNEVFSYTSVGESILDQTFKDYVNGEGGDLQGELDKFSLGHVVQFLHSAGESGTLTINSSERQTDKLIFDRGQIIDAVCGNRCGEAAAETVLRKRQGTFKFTREDNSKRLRLIQQDTMSMLMEAARLIDEKGWAN